MMAKPGAFGVACLLIIGMYAPAFGEPESHGGEVKTEEGLALLAGGLNWTGYLSQAILFHR